MPYGRSITDEESVRQNGQTAATETPAPAGNLEFRLMTDLTPIKETVLTANFEEVEAQLRELLAPYEKMVLREEDIPEGKNLLARIRKVKATVDDYRKSIKRDFTAPLAAFEEKCKALTAVCAESETNLSEQINKYAEQRKAEKLAGLRAFFDESVGEMKPYLRYEQIENSRWGNVTYSVEQAQQEIKQAIDMCADGVEAIRGLGSEFEATLLTAYAKSHDLAAVMKMNSELSETKKREAARREAEEARRREAEAARKEAEEREKARLEAARAAAQAQAAKYKLDDEPAPAKEQTVYQHGDVPKENVYTLAFRVRATRSQLVELRAAFDRIGIWFEKIEG